MKSCCQIHSMHTESLNPSQRKNTGMFKVNSFSTTCYTKGCFISNPRASSCEPLHKLRSEHLGICRLCRIAGNNFRVVVPNVPGIKERIIQTAACRGFSAPWHSLSIINSMLSRLKAYTMSCKESMSTIAALSFNYGQR
uniref:Uncharacterized protein n=1 Tax=Salix viminalis TaxID=40686 RepID=A0A6N2NFL6_SALVM